MNEITRIWRRTRHRVTEQVAQVQSFNDASVFDEEAEGVEERGQA